jgi:hypothetical protein
MQSAQFPLPAFQQQAGQHHVLLPIDSRAAVTAQQLPQTAQPRLAQTRLVQKPAQLRHAQQPLRQPAQVAPAGQQHAGQPSPPELQQQLQAGKLLPARQHYQQQPAQPLYSDQPAQRVHAQQQPQQHIHTPPSQEQRQGQQLLLQQQLAVPFLRQLPDRQDYFSSPAPVAEDIKPFENLKPAKQRRCFGPNVVEKPHNQQPGQSSTAAAPRAQLMQQALLQPCNKGCQAQPHWQRGRRAAAEEGQWLKDCAEFGPLLRSIGFDEAAAEQYVWQLQTHPHSNQRATRIIFRRLMELMATAKDDYMPAFVQVFYFSSPNRLGSCGH